MAAEAFRAERLRAELHGFSPSKPGQHQANGAERIEVLCGIEREAAQRPGEAIALEIGGQRVRILVHGDGADQRESEQDEQGRIVTKKG
jgi:hypothetical protein